MRKLRSLLVLAGVVVATTVHAAGAWTVTTNPAAEPQAKAASAGGLRVGEYACYGSRNRIMIGLSVKVRSPGHYINLDSTHVGTYTIEGDKVNFHDGHMNGQQGRELNDGNFRIGVQAVCQPYLARSGHK
ncbi:MAG: hypothetical protein ABI672_07870 [Vicinamibacteria bacterium]